MAEKDSKDPSPSAPEELTPITKQPIPQVKTSSWLEMSVSELFDQRTILMQRLAYAQRISPTMAHQLMIGVEMIDAIIDSKETNETRLM